MVTGYLQRLLDSTGPAAPALTPVVRSDSPVFAGNQLLALEGYDSFVPVVAAPAPSPAAGEPSSAFSAALPANTALAHEPVAPAPPPDFATTLASGLVPASPAGAVSRAAPAAAPGADSVRHPAGQDAGQDAGQHAGQHAGTLAPRLERRASPRTPVPPALPPAPDPALMPASTPTAGRGGDRAGLSLAERAAPLEALAPARHASTAPPTTPGPGPVRTFARVDTPLPRTGPGQGRAAGEVMPRPRALAPTGPDADPRPPRTAYAARPAAGITIGHVTVEVVPEPRAAPEPARTRTGAQAASAESASCIGPLGDLRAARRLFALRRF